MEPTGIRGAAQMNLTGAICRANLVGCLLLLNSAAGATSIDVTESFDFSANPITLVPFDPSVSQNLGAGQYVTVSVNLGQQFSSFSDLVISGVVGREELGATGYARRGGARV